MDWSQTPRVLLVWPERGKVLRNRLDLVLLERYSSSHGSQLAILTKDPEVIFHAGEAGIPVFQSRRTAQLQPWRKSFREFKRRELTEKASVVRDSELFSRIEKPIHTDLPTWTRIAVFIGAVFAVLAIAGMLLPGATITIQPEINQKSLILPVRAIIGEDQILISGQILLGNWSSRLKTSNQFPLPGRQRSLQNMPAVKSFSLISGKKPLQFQQTQFSAQKHQILSNFSRTTLLD